MGLLTRANVASVRITAIITIVAAIAMYPSLGILSALIICLAGALLWALAGSPRAGGLRRFSGGMVYFVLLIMGLGAGA